MAAEKEVKPDTVKVKISRPQGVTDSHMFIGFNGMDMQIAFGKEVVLPKTVVDHIQRVETVEYTVGEKGNPVANYTKKFNVEVLK